MNDAGGPLGGSPADVLAAAARRLGAAGDPLALWDRFESHASPLSLRALIEIAREIGIEARAFETDESALAGLALPAIVHLREAGDGEDPHGFGLLVGVEREPRGYVLQAPGGIGRRRLSAGEFLERWTGVVVTLAALAPEALPEPPRASIRERLAGLVRRRHPGGPVLALARVLAAVAVPALGLVAALRFGAREGSAWVAAAGGVAVVLNVAGALACGVLLMASRRTQLPAATPSLASAICGRGGIVDCESVLSSRWARIGGVDLASLGLAFFCANLLAAAVAGFAGPAAAGGVFTWLAAASLAAVPGSLALIALQIYPLRRVCPLCMTVHAAVLGSAGLGLPLLLRLEELAAGLRLVAPHAALHALAFAAALGLLVPYLELGLESRALFARLGWIASTPWGALAEIAARPALGPREPAAPIRLGDPRAPFRVDALVHPFCTACPPVIEQLAALVRRHPGALQVGFHLPPRDPGNEADRELCAALGAVGLLAGGEPTLHVLRAVEERPWPMLELARSGAEAVIARFLPEDADPRPVLPRARAAVVHADRLSAALGRGTPTVLLNGRTWDVPLDDLDALLEHHPELLAEVLDLPAPRAEPREAERPA